jgi:hypothetical protein
LLPYSWAYLCSVFQVFVHADGAALTGPYAGHPIVQQFLQWLSTADVRNSIGKNFSVGGRYMYPPVAGDMNDYISSFPADKPMQVT